MELFILVYSNNTGKDPDAGKDWRQEEKGRTEDEMVDGITMDMSLSKLWELVMDRESWRAAVHGSQRAEMTEWTELTEIKDIFDWDNGTWL